MFSSRDLRRLLIPLIIEQLLTALIGMVDTMMVANVGSAAVSAVSLVDSINALMQMFFVALATGGTIICSQYTGRGQREGARMAAGQLLMMVWAVSLVLAAVCGLARGPLLRLIYGSVEQSVMDASMIYFLITALSYPFLAVFSASAALFRSVGNSRLPMLVSLGANIVNAAGNALLIFGLKMGVAGAALATLLSRLLSAVVLRLWLMYRGGEIAVGPIFRLRPQRGEMLRIMRIGIPTGVESCMFQFGKLVIQSTVSTLGTTVLAANALTSTLEYATSLPAMAVGTGMLTVIAQCMGAGRPDEARRYTKKLMLISEAALVAANLLVFVGVGPITRLAGLEPEAAALTKRLTYIICIVKLIPWTFAFTLQSTLKASGDVNFTMLASALSMWLCRVVVTVVLVRVVGIGVMGVWIGMFTDWYLRGAVMLTRYLRGKWMNKEVLD